MTRAIRSAFPATDGARPIATFRRLFFAAVCAGALAGVVAAAAHQFLTVPLIQRAETYETLPTAPHDHAAQAASWQPAEGLERAFFTLLADILAGIGYALLLVAGMAWRRGPLSWRGGAWWGLAGFVAFSLAPAIGLPPELPGTAVAPLFPRQLWWLATAIVTAGGLFSIACGRRPLWVLAGLALIALPHLIGAPQPAVHAAGTHTATVPPALAAAFQLAAMASNLLFWLVLGAAGVFFLRRFAPAA